MSLDDAISKFLGNLYEAVYDRESWKAAIEEITRRSGGHRALVATVDLGRRGFSRTELHGPSDSSTEDGMREYDTEMSALDPVLKWTIDNPMAGICDSAALVRPDDPDDPFLNWSKGRFGTRHWRVFYSAPVDGLFFGLSLHAPNRERLDGGARLRLQKLMFENLERAVRLAARPPNFAADDSALIAVDSAGRILSLSVRAEEILRDEDGLVIKGGFLTTQTQEDASLVERAIRAAIDPQRGEFAGRGIRIRRSFAQSDLLLVVSYFPPALNHLPRPVPTALIRLIELDSGPQYLSEHSHLFDLSPRETEVASALLQGHSIDSLSAFLGISRNTARNHLQALFEKTETNRQSHLIQVLDRISRQ